MLRKTCLSAFVLSLAAAAAPAQDLYDTTVLRNLDFQFHDANWWALLQQNYASQTNILADLTVEGVTYPDVGVRIRGNTSYTALPAGSEKVSLNVEVDYVNAGQNVMGYDSLNLNNSFHDPTFCREVAYSNVIARHIPAGRANHVTVSLNGQNWGVYANVQQWNKDVLREWFVDEDGLRIKCANNPNGPGLRYVGASASLYTSGYEIKNDGGLADPWGALIAVCNAVTNGSLTTWESSIDSVFAVDPSIWSVALENLYTDDDSYVNKGADFVIYRDPIDGRTHLQQTDANETFTATTWSPTLNFTSSTKPVLSHVLAVPELRQRYMAHLRSALAEFDWATLDAELTAYRTLIDAAVQADPKKLYTYAQFQTNFTSAVNLGGGGPFGGTVPGLQEFVVGRRALMDADPEVSAPAPLVSNVAHSPANPAVTDSVWITATVQPNVSAVAAVELYYRPAPGSFLHTPMFDDGLHNDGAAGDQVWGVQLPVSASAGQEVAYYVGAEAANAYGSLAFAPAGTELQAQEVVYAFGSSGLRITEYLYSGTDGEFFELTNTTAAAIDLTGWSYDDDSATAGTVDLSAAGVVAPGQSIVVTEADPATFAAAWGLSGVTVVTTNGTAGLGRNDQINVFDAGGQLVERLSYGDESYPGSIRTKDASGQTCDEGLGLDDAYAWTLSQVGDAWGSTTSAGGDVGTPGSYPSVTCDLSLGTNYCLALPNQAGTTASISASGSALVANQNLTLHVTGATPSQSGVFFLGHGTAQVPFANGYRCVTGPLVRIVPVLQTDAAGAASRALDFLAPYAAHLVPGTTVYFQFWYRDAGSSNLTDGLRLDLL
ncbi:MAG: CotH kinase family protein [Planctomycetes bacterium]|nr:CotH kinase family protein [Planctomycetota bacterium]